MKRLTIYAERVREGDTLVTGPEGRELRRLVVQVTRTGDRVFLSCSDLSTPVLPVGRLVKVERDDGVAERNPADARLIPGTPKAA